MLTDIFVYNQKYQSFAKMTEILEFLDIKVQFTL